MEIIVIGCGRLGSALAYRLFKAGHKVAIIDSNQAAFQLLPADFRGRMHEGDALSQDVLVRAGIEHADGLAVVTNLDAINAVIGHVGRVVFNIKNVIVRNYDPRCRPLFEDLGLQVVSSTSWGAQRIEEMLSAAELMNVFSAGNGEVEVYEFVIPEGWAGKALGDLLPVEECMPVSVTRAGRAFFAKPEIVLQAGDVMHVSASDTGIHYLREKLSKGSEV